jgi:hypothetical protein
VFLLRGTDHDVSRSSYASLPSPTPGPQTTRPSSLETTPFSFLTLAPVVQKFYRILSSPPLFFLLHSFFPGHAAFQAFLQSFNIPGWVFYHPTTLSHDTSNIPSPPMVNPPQNHQAQQVFFPLLLSRVISFLLLPSPSLHFALPPLGKDNLNPFKGLNHYTFHRPTTALFGPRHFHPQNVHTLLSLLSNITFSPYFQEHITNPSINLSLPFQTPFTFLSIPIHHIDRMRFLHNLLKQQQPNLMPTQIHFIMPDSSRLKATSLLLEARVTFLSTEEIQ